MILNNKTWYILDTFFKRFIKFGLLQFCCDAFFNIYIISYHIITTLNLLNRESLHVSEGSLKLHFTT